MTPARDMMFPPARDVGETFLYGSEQAKNRVGFRDSQRSLQRVQNDGLKKPTVNEAKDCSFPGETLGPLFTVYFWASHLRKDSLSRRKGLPRRGWQVRFPRSRMGARSRVILVRRP